MMLCLSSRLLRLIYLPSKDFSDSFSRRCAGRCVSRQNPVKPIHPALAESLASPGFAPTQAMAVDTTTIKGDTTMQFSDTAQ
jgi:hypothetical protein